LSRSGGVAGDTNLGLNSWAETKQLAEGEIIKPPARPLHTHTVMVGRNHVAAVDTPRPNFAKREFLYRLSRSNYEKEWGKDYVKPGLGTPILSTLLRYMPRIGPFKGLAFNNPTPQTEDVYIKSINTTADQYRAFLEAVRTDTLVPPNCDFDSGKPTKAAESSLTDDVYAKLLGQLSDRKFDRTSPELRANVLDFYSDLSPPIDTKTDQVRWWNVRCAGPIEVGDSDPDCRGQRRTVRRRAVHLVSASN
jgi:hypothetical protein